MPGDCKRHRISRWMVSGAIGVGFWISLAGCSVSSLVPTIAPPTFPGKPIAIAADQQSPLWADNFQRVDWRSRWQVREKEDWGWQNVTVVADPTRKFPKVLRVHYPAGSASPSVAKHAGVPVGGAQFYADLGLPPGDTLHLSYALRFSEGFDFVKGGKLPGLFGGTETSGGNIPDGTNGFSTRFMWRSRGKGEVYAYLPTSKKYGTSIGRGRWQFTPGVWHRLEQQVNLNQPGKKDGRVQVWLDGKKVLDKGNLTFRTTETLKIEGIFFSTFFGGGDRSWATPKAVYVDFADFAVYGGKEG